MQSLERSADEELLGSFAGISTSLISFCRSTELQVYIAIAEALEGMDDVAELLNSGEDDLAPPFILQVRKVAPKTLLPPPSDDAFRLASQLVRGRVVVEVPGLWSREGDNPPDPISLPDLRPLSDYPLAPCKHECSLIKQARHVRQVLVVFESMEPVNQALMRASAG